MPISRKDIIKKNHKDETPVLMLRPDGQPAEMPRWRVGELIEYKGWRKMEDCPDEWKALKDKVRIPSASSANTASIMAELSKLRRAKQESDDLVVAQAAKLDELESKPVPTPEPEKDENPPKDDSD